VIIGGIINGLSQYIMAGKNYKTYEDLRGATLGANSLTAGTAFAFRRVLKAKGLEFPRDYKLINVGGTPQAFAALASGQIAAAPLSLPVNYAAEEQGFNEIGRFVDVIPNYQLAALSAKRSWAEKNRPVLVRVMRAMAQTMRWMHQNRDATADFLAKEMKLKPEHARRGWEFYTSTRTWHPDGDVNIDGLQVVTQIYFEQTQLKGPVPNAAKYVDQSYLREALKEIGPR
jgi:ABC-type nitrate/sulfonate/bicarbonate transport system substrate-binding protein